MNVGTSDKFYDGSSEFSVKMNKLGLPPPISNLQLPEAGLDYIYRPRGQEVIMTFLEKETRKLKFINI